MNLDNIMLSKRSQSQRSLYSIYMKVSKGGRPIEAESRSVDGLGLGDRVGLRVIREVMAKRCSFFLDNFFLYWLQWDFPGGPVVETSPSSARGLGLIPAWGAKIPTWVAAKKHKTEAIV